MTYRRCKICFKLIAKQRRRQHPVATTCGGRCQVENRRRVHLDTQTTRTRISGRANVLAG